MHNVLWSAGQIVNSQQVIFWGVDATRPSDADGMKNVTVDDTYQRPKSASDSDSGVGGSVGLEYKGNWTQIGMGSTQEAVGKGLAVASSRGSSVTFQGQGGSLVSSSTKGTTRPELTLRLGNILVWTGRSRPGYGTSIDEWPSSRAEH